MRDLLVLMDTHETEPILSLRKGSEELDLMILEGPIEPLIPHIAHAIESKLCVPLLHKYRLDLYVVCFWSPSVVVD